jgi:hypothetical protein
VTLLSEPLALHDVRDVEAMCRSILDRQLRAYRAHYLNPDDYEDVLALFVSTAWEWSLTHDPDRELSFSSYLNRYLGPRLADWFRRRFGDARYGPPPEVVTLEPELDTPAVFTISRSTLTEAPASFEEVETRASLPPWHEEELR